MVGEYRTDSGSFGLVRIPEWPKKHYKVLSFDNGSGNIPMGISSDYLVSVFRGVDISGHKTQIKKLCKKASKSKITESQLIEKIKDLFEK